MRANRGTLTEPGKNSPFRDRSVEENLDLFRRMRAGEFPNGARVLRAKIDMASRQHQPARPGALPHPARARIRAPARPGTSIRATISRTASPTRSRASRIRSARSNSRITGRSTTGSSSNLPVPSRPHQYEFARLNLTYTVLSKRVLTQLVRDGHVERLGRSAHADARRACAGAACRRRRSAISSSASASPRPTAWSTSACSNFPSARCSTRPRCGAWRCCGR